MLESGRFNVSHVDGWERWVLSGPWRAKYADQIRRRGLLALELNEVKGFVGQDLDFLRDIPELLELQVVHHHLDDDSGVAHCGELRKLRLNTYCDTSPDFGRFTQLEDCSLEWRDAASSLLGVSTLRRLRVQNPPWVDLHPLHVLTGLVSLLLGNARRLSSLDGVDSLRPLESLEIHLAPRLPSLSGIENLGSLISLDIDSCRKVSSLEPVRSLRRLQRLHLDDGGPVDSLDPVRDLVELQELWFYGSTNVVDGRVGFLQDLPSLREVRLQNRRHYDAKRDALNAALQSRHVAQTTGYG